MNNIKGDVVVVRGSEELKKAKAAFNITEVKGRSQSAPISRQGCISFTA